MFIDLLTVVNEDGETLIAVAKSNGYQNILNEGERIEAIKSKPTFKVLKSTVKEAWSKLDDQDYTIAFICRNRNEGIEHRE